MPDLWLLSAVARPRWRSLFVIAVLVALSGGVVLAAVAGARRSASSIDRFERAAHEMDVFVSAPEEVDGARTAPLRELLEGPLVRHFRELKFVFGFPAAEGAAEAFLFAPVEPEPRQIAQGLLLDGRRADPTDPHEIVPFETTAELLGLDVGDTLDIATLTPEQVVAFGIPLGFLVGRLVWSATASSMGVATDASQPFRQTAIGAILVLVTSSTAGNPTRGVRSCPLVGSARRCEPRPRAGGRGEPSIGGECG